MLKEADDLALNIRHRPVLRHDLCSLEQCRKITGRVKQMLGADVAISTILEPLAPRETIAERGDARSGASPSFAKKKKGLVAVYSNNPAAHTLLCKI